MSKINLYPKIENINLPNLVKVNYKCFYTMKNTSKQLLSTKPLNEKNMIELYDDIGEFDSSLDKVYMDIEILLANVNYLFGLSGICYRDSTLGLGIEWKSNNSRIKNSVKIGEFCYGNNFVTLRKEKIELFDLSSDTTFKWIIYIAKPGEKEGKNYFGNFKGLVIGNAELFTIKGEGIGSIFPISETTDKAKPLFSYFINFVDPFDDSFTIDNVKILLNKDNQAYEFLQMNNMKYNPNFLANTLSTAITFLILDITSQIDKDDYKNKAAAPGSIVAAIKFFEKNLKFKIYCSPKELLESIQLFFDKEFR